LQRQVYGFASAIRTNLVAKDGLPAYLMECYMKDVKFHVEGLAPLLMHNDRFSNPLDPLTQAHKELTAKKKKTDADQREIMKSEWIGSLYHDEDIGIYMPGQNLYATLFTAAKMRKLGLVFKRAALYPDEKIPLQYNGSSDLEVLFKNQAFRDVRAVKVSTSRIMRCRPKFIEWSLDFSLPLDDNVLNVKELLAIANDAGKMVGLCDYRPRFGKFTIEVA
jgi:hypothetical protein